jgi:ABC-type nitrate/sulfonate/bicarbonate transport system substrate-binding protein
MHEFAKMSDVRGSSFPMNVMVARRSFVEKNRDTVKRFQQAYAEGVYQFMNSKDKGLAVLSKWLRFKNPKAVEETYHYFAKSFSFPTRVSHEGLRNALEVTQQRNPSVKVDLAVNRYLDESTVDELEREGFFKKLAGK